MQSYGKNVIAPSHKSHKSENALDKYPTVHHFVTEMCYKAVYCGILDDYCIVGFMQQV